MVYPTEGFKTELATELDSILRYWEDFSVDHRYGGFVGQRDHCNRLIPHATKGVILNTRILWTFSATGNFLGDKALMLLAQRSYNYLKDHFLDQAFGGLYWEVDFKGHPINKRKQIYAQAFGIYSLAQYYQLCGREEAKQEALALFGLIEQHARDPMDNGYLEAFGQDWTPIADMRLSEKDKNSAKTMNTHLHILEAYTSLLKITQDKKVEEALENLISLFLEKFYQPENHHFQLFFDQKWRPEGKLISYGHDIEAAWLLIEAAEVVANKALREKTRNTAVEIADTFLREAYTPGMGVANQIDMESGVLDTDRHWWPQVEAMIGLDYAYRISGNEKFAEAIVDIWNFTNEHMIDVENGEWFFRLDEHNKPYREEDKLGMWKCPYHNSRGLMMLLSEYL